MADRRAYFAARYAANREKAAAYSAAYRATHREFYAAYAKAHRAAHPEEHAARYAAWYAANREKKAAYDRTYRYGITEDEYDALMEYQGGLCAAGCGAPATDIDHDHETGDIRGLLCRSCNRMDALAPAVSVHLGVRFKPGSRPNDTERVSPLV